MSRNLCSDRCPTCDRLVKVEDLKGCVIDLRKYHNESPRPLIDFTCNCGTRLLVWIMDMLNHGKPPYNPILDLSYYESFNDEPNSEGDKHVYYRP